MLTLSCDTVKCKRSVILPMEVVYDHGINIDFSVAVGWQIRPDGEIKCDKHADKKVNKKKKRK